MSSSIPLNWLVNRLKGSPVCTPEYWSYRFLLLSLAFMWMLEILTQALMLMRQELYRLSRFSSLSYDFFGSKYFIPFSHRAMAMLTSNVIKSSACFCPLCTCGNMWTLEV